LRLDAAPGQRRAWAGAGESGVWPGSGVGAHGDRAQDQEIRSVRACRRGRPASSPILAPW
jgi:hypothetical protein